MIITDRPLIISPVLIPPTLTGMKQITRRLTGLEPVNEEPDRWKFVGLTDDPRWPGRLVAFFTDVEHQVPTRFLPCPYGKVNDTLWIRENWAVGKGYDGIKPRNIPKGVHVNRWYMADGSKPGWCGRTWPSIFIPRWLSRIDLLITGIRVERLHDITEEDAILEGVQPNCDGFDLCPSVTCRANGCQSAGEYFHYLHDIDGDPAYSALESFESLWIKLNGAASWNRNPWIWRISFTKLKPVT